MHKGNWTMTKKKNRSRKEAKLKARHVRYCQSQRKQEMIKHPMLKYSQ